MEIAPSGGGENIHCHPSHGTSSPHHLGRTALSLKLPFVFEMVEFRVWGLGFRA